MSTLRKGNICVFELPVTSDTQIYASKLGTKVMFFMVPSMNLICGEIGPSSLYSLPKTQCLFPDKMTAGSPEKFVGRTD